MVARAGKMVRIPRSAIKTCTTAPVTSKAYWKFYLPPFHYRLGPSEVVDGAPPDTRSTVLNPKMLVRWGYVPGLRDVSSRAAYHSAQKGERRSLLDQTRERKRVPVGQANATIRLRLADLVWVGSAVD